MVPDQQPAALRSRRAFSGRVINVDIDGVRLPSGREVDLEMVRHPGAAAIVALLDEATNDPSVLLINQYRYAAAGMIWEIPAGVLESGETPSECAARELHEETGATAASLEHLTTVFTTPGFTDERIHLFLATGVTPGEPRLASDEFLRVEARPLTHVLEMIRDGEIADAKSIVALLYTAGYRLGL